MVGQVVMRWVTLAQAARVARLLGVWIRGQGAMSFLQTLCVLSM
jgi:hypothetical protein